MSDKGMHERVGDLEILITGNGHPERGMIVRLDRIERELALLRWIGWGLCAGVGTILPTVIVLLFK